MKEFIMHVIFGIILLCFVVFVLLSCKGKMRISRSKYKITNYSDESNWLVNPGKDAPKPVDVFYLYPTFYVGPEHAGAVTNFIMREGARINHASFASVYEKSANLYMPYYRQMNADYLLTLPPKDQERFMRGIPGIDCINAFIYYIDHYNHGRPFILAGHSQGSNTLLYVLEYMRTRPELMQRFIAAYAIGYTVTDEFLRKNPPLKFATGPTDLQVVVSWNTESPGLTVPNPVVNPGALAINPISWTTDETHAPKEDSKGSRIGLITNFEDRPHHADAQVNKERGVVVCSTVDPRDYKLPSSLFEVGIMHAGDYALYYYDLQQNVADRIAAYFNSKKN
ncbi:DUF3089 domain-containing protein [Paludibacter sp. 221]|uniref:DUF3089 domain-containing protein n=1 Tax=Paludibacter sp. 221 TaxID=2302939 RepID=UPI0013D863E1|nr:DUF3089 domain-containing protein [Paludibacter sp. 221]NDV45839.1 DUF3089 domain-containing protein [Paludibacter sp. 221]